MVNPEKLVEPLQKFNQEMISVEDQQIDDYLVRRNWKMNRSKSGLRWIVYKEGAGMTPQVGQIVELKYVIRLIRGDEVYNSEKDGVKKFRVDQSEEIAGLHELVQYLKVGDKCQAVIPSYLAYGLIGDEKRIPKKATLFFDVQLMKILN